MKAREAYATPLISGGSMLRLHSLLAWRLMLVAWLIPWITTASMYDPRRNNTTVRWRPLGKGVHPAARRPDLRKVYLRSLPLLGLPRSDHGGRSEALY